MRAYKAIFIVITVVASLFSVAGVALSAITYDTVYVDDTGPVGGNHFHDIETALSLVNPDGTIYIAAGYYDLSLPLVPAADVAFIGEGADVVTIDATGLTSALNIEDVSVYIYGCSITGAHTCVSIDWNNGEGTYEAYLHNNAIYGAMELDSGISLGLDNASGEVTIRGNEIYDNSGYGISVSSIDSDLVLVIEGNAIHGNDDSGIFIYSECGSLETHIDGNEICGNGAVSFFNTGINIRFLTCHIPLKLA